MKIDNISIVGVPDIRPLNSMTYIVTKAEMKAEGINIPTDEQLEIYDKPSLYWIVLNKFEVHLTVDGKWYNFYFDRGFTYDLMSCPKIIRFIADESDQRGIIPAAVHDALFTSHFLDYETSNEIFRSLLVYNGMSRPLARVYWLGVASFVGKIMYNKKTIKRATWQLSRFRFIEGLI
jgi:hypothetical protein